jgi:hypothetical protein
VHTDALFVVAAQLVVMCTKPPNTFLVLLLLHANVDVHRSDALPLTNQQPHVAACREVHQLFQLSLLPLLEVHCPDWYCSVTSVIVVAGLFEKRGTCTNCCRLIASLSLASRCCFFYEKMCHLVVYN